MLRKRPPITKARLICKILSLLKRLVTRTCALQGRYLCPLKRLIIIFGLILLVIGPGGSAPVTYLFHWLHQDQHQEISILILSIPILSCDSILYPRSCFDHNFDVVNDFITLLKHFTGHYHLVIIFCDNARVRSHFIYFLLENK